MDEQGLSWSSPEFNFVERTAGWYLASMCVAAVLAIVALFQKNFLFFLLVIVSEIALLLVARQKPRLYGYRLTEEGILVNETMVYLFSALRGFAMVDDGVSGYVELVILPSKRFSQFSKILVPRPLMQSVFSELSSRLKVLQYEEHFLEMILKRIGL